MSFLLRRVVKHIRHAWRYMAQMPDVSICIPGYHG
jgi:hypothetical protein